MPAHEAHYFNVLARGDFEIPCCDACGRWHFFPRVCCPFCHSEALTWKRPSGAGTVYSTTTVRKPDGGDYCVCLVDLDEGPRMMSTVVGTPPDQVFIGQKVRAQVLTSNQPPLLVFTAREVAA